LLSAVAWPERDGAALLLETLHLWLPGLCWRRGMLGRGIPPCGAARGFAHQLEEALGAAVFQPSARQRKMYEYVLP